MVLCMCSVRVLCMCSVYVVSDIDVSTSLAIHDLIGNILSFRYELMLDYGKGITTEVLE